MLEKAELFSWNDGSRSEPNPCQIMFPHLNPRTFIKCCLSACHMPVLGGMGGGTSGLLIWHPRLVLGVLVAMKIFCDRQLLLFIWHTQAVRISTNKNGLLAAALICMMSPWLWSTFQDLSGQPPLQRDSQGCKMACFWHTNGAAHHWGSIPAR